VDKLLKKFPSLLSSFQCSYYWEKSGHYSTSWKILCSDQTLSLTTLTIWQSFIPRQNHVVQNLSKVRAPD